MDLIEIANQQLLELSRLFPLGYEPKLIWKPLRVTAGQALYLQGTIALSSKVIVTEEQLRDTLVHEYAHLLAVSRHGRKAANHGEHWQQAMRDLGAEPKRTHGYAVSRNQRHQEVVYRCKGCGAEIVTKRLLNRKRRYLHRDCGAFITYSHHREKE
ncbi:MAG TPA: SprT-like domain-containing protein [Fimbriimonadaceae bacterium]|nr:SprT-like domain-containing protein [Fimbriimonadaceae bacterium]